MEKEKIKGFEDMDRFLQAIQSRFDAGLSPTALMLAYFDWAIHLANSPGKQLELLKQLYEKQIKCINYWFKGSVDPECPVCEEPMEYDRRWQSEEWKKWPFNIYYQTFLLTQRWWQNATTGILGVSCHHEDVVSFVTRQALDIFSPTNFILTNPEVLKVTMEEKGANLLKGLANVIEDTQCKLEGKKPKGAERYKVGKNLALTPGKVIFKNDLMELIQYEPQTQKVYAQPVLIIPAWIMKYYILDLIPEKSLVKFLVDKGHTVFMVSWKNPGPEDRDKGMDDYLKQGAMAAINIVSQITPSKKIHTVGYCLGGTLLTIAAAVMARKGDNRLETITLLAAQVDFTEAGELMLFIDEGQVTYLENQMWFDGYLDAKIMSGAFQLLRSNDLIWSRLVNEYLLGKRQPMFDLMAWNNDATRMPYRMHSEYLRKLFLQNELSRGRYEVDGLPIAVSDIRCPAFLVSTIKDHVAPWRSVYKFNLSSDAERITFVLTSGGHNAGIISEPDHPRRTYQISTRREGEKYIDPDTWRKTTPVKKGSWWLAWQEWLVENSSGEMPSPRTMGDPENGIVPIMDAPGSYVLVE
jgi:polyhydroxyalkanoate synthase subunit PhaC